MNCVGIAELSQAPKPAVGLVSSRSGCHPRVPQAGSLNYLGYAES